MLARLSNWGRSFTQSRQPDAYEAIYVTLPLDGGYAWIIMMVSFFCCFATDGSLLSFGKLTIGLSEAYGVNDGDIALILSLQTCMEFLVGPFVSAVVNKFGFRIAAALGAIISIIGIVVTAYTSKYIYLVIFYGFLTGIGFGLIFTTAIIIVGYYFEKYRALAVGVAMSGSGIGTIVISPCITIIVRDYGVVTFFLAQAGMFGVLFILVLFYRQIKPTRLVVEVVKQDSESSESSESRITSLLQPDKTKILKYNEIYKIPSSPTISYVNEFQADRVRPFPRLGSQNAAGQAVSLDVVATASEPRPPCCRHCINNICYYSCCCFLCRKCRDHTTEKIGTDTYANRPLYREDIFFTQSLVTLPDYNESIFQSNSSTTSLAQPEAHPLNIHLSVIRAIENQPKDHEKHCCPRSITNVIGLLFDVSLLKSFTFEVISLATVINIQGLFIPYFFITDRALAYNMPPAQASYLVSTMGLATTVGRLSCGLLSFFPINPCHISGLMSLLSGAATLVSACRPHDDIHFTLIYSLIYGLGTAYFTTLRSVIFVNNLGLEKLTNAFGLNSLMLGVAALIGPTVAGIIRVQTQSYFLPLVYCAICIFMGGVILLMVPCIRKWETNRQNKARDLTKS